MNKYNFSNSDISLLSKLYPEIKVPNYEHFDYYIDLLEKTGYNVVAKICDYEECKEIYGDVYNYKDTISNRVKEYLQSEYKLDIHMKNFEDVNLPFKKKVSKLKPETSYLSLDLREANFSAYRFFYPDKHDSWYSVMSFLGVHDVLALSKTFRQYIFGVLDPKSQMRIQRYMIGLILTKLSQEYGSSYLDSIVSITNDEIIFEDYTNKLYLSLEEIALDLNIRVKLTEFKVAYKINFGEEICLKYSLGSFNNPVKLVNVPGNRFYLHLKTLIINKKLQDKDLYFEPEPKRLAKWIV